MFLWAMVVFQNREQKIDTDKSLQKLGISVGVVFVFEKREKNAFDTKGNKKILLG